MDNTMNILHNENHEKINKLEEILILKAATSLNIFNDVINSRNNLFYKILSQLTARSQHDNKPKEMQPH